MFGVVNMKVYMVKEELTGLYCSEVVTKIRLDIKDGAYIYDKKHAARVMKDARQYFRSKDEPYQLAMIPMSIDEVPFNELAYGNLSAEFFTARGISFLQGLRQIRYEQVRKYNGLIDFDPHESKSREARRAFSMI